MKSHAALNGEESVLFTHEHWIKYLPAAFLLTISWLLYATYLIVSFALRDVSHTGSIAIAVAGNLFLLVFHHGAFFSYFCASSRRTLVTNRRILTSDQQPWFSDDMTDTPLWRIRSIEVRKKGLLQHILGYGSLVFNQGELQTIKHILHPHDAHTQIISQVQSMQPALERHGDVQKKIRGPVLEKSFPISVA
ncbi:hypothetical protein COU79_05700 [Candidatus Peregrinibacteria bacterium CG10_big_fil_rev_8_21_14_0_10_54_7]|nr:MAG: hypothetical protein COU79_05700 [Candidatus Peregrinibacteria bacterium CG10_big_fil_rev_8_21_14_0_10_54_7]